MGTGPSSPSAMSPGPWDLVPCLPEERGIPCRGTQMLEGRMGDKCAGTELFPPHRNQELWEHWAPAAPSLILNFLPGKGVTVLPQQQMARGKGDG